ncbi:MAG: hypothetical protein KA297_02605 [Kofleriaceae bacterium]|nr:hypothetical protein [Kofleriaceae bacterium]MBP6836578.1 hypothetical protein [Kofleriaceae bacterium]
MGHLDEARFGGLVRGCAACGAAALELRTIIDRQVGVMFGDAVDDGRWAHDGEKFIDGVYAATCTACAAVAFASADCPRCHRVDGLAAALGGSAGLAVPKRCPGCGEGELTAVGFAPGRVVTGGGKREPTPLAALGEPGFHVAALLCDQCDWTAVADGCPLCAGPGPLRPRP